MRRWRVLSGLGSVRTVGRIRRLRRIRHALHDAAKAKKVDGVEYFFSAIFIDAREGNPYANVFFFC
ncbi:hypothetical protein E0K74_05185 [Escherichia coli]|nr:hypothetical protein E0K74_05185 [Escherichia coli]